MSRSCARIGSPCLRHCVHGASINRWLRDWGTARRRLGKLRASLLSKRLILRRLCEGEHRLRYHLRVISMVIGTDLDWLRFTYISEIELPYL
eukprot:COSAG01_NODE_4411_length_5051_cov_3.166397_5_plen_92_part_00